MSCSLCSSTVISPIHSPLAPPHSEPHPPTDDTPSNFTMSVTTPILYGLSHPPIGHRSSDRTSPGPKNRPTHALQTAPTASSKRSSRLQNEQRIRSPLDYVVPISPHQQHGIRTRQHFREDFSYIIDAKERGNIGRYINVCSSCFLQLALFNSPSLSSSIAALQTCLFKMCLSIRTICGFRGWPSLQESELYFLHTDTKLVCLFSLSLSSPAPFFLSPFLPPRISFSVVSRHCRS